MRNKQVCDVCGREIEGKAQYCLIEGAKLRVCSNCAKFGTKIIEKPTFKSKSTIRRRYRRYDDMQDLELVEDFNKIIKREREKRGWTQAELARRIKVRESLIRNIESGRIPPDDVRKKLENILGVSLVTTADISEYYVKPSSKTELTLGDVVHFKRKKPKKE